MNAAELVELVMDLVEDERLVVVGREVLDNFIYYSSEINQ